MTRGGRSALSNLLLHFYLLSSSSRVSSHCQSRSGMQFSGPQGFPCRGPATRSAVVHLPSSVSVALLSLPCTVIFEPPPPPSLLLSRSTEISCVSVGSSRLLPLHMIRRRCGWLGGVACGSPQRACDVGRREQPALCSSSTGVSPPGLNSAHHFLLLQTKSVCVCVCLCSDSWFRVCLRLS